MCKPATLTKDEAEAVPSSKNPSVVPPNDNNKDNAVTTTEKMDIARRNLQRGTLYGSLSLAFLVAGMSLTMPHLQSRRDALGCDSLCYGSMTSVRSALALVGSAIMGRLSDSGESSFLARAVGGGSGRKACMYIGSVASIIGLVVGGATHSLQGMWLALIPGALLQQNFSVLKAQLADYHEAIEEEEESSNKQDKAAAAEGGATSTDKNATASRAGSVGKLGMAVGLAFMVGPLFGATVVKTYGGAVRLSLVLTVVSAVLIGKIPRAQKKAPPKQLDAKAASSSYGIQNFLDVKVARSTGALFIMFVRCCMALSFHIFQTIWTVSLKERFDFGPADHGKFMSFIGLSYALSQGVVAKRVTEFFGAKNRVALVQACCVALGAGRYLAFHTENLVVVYVVFASIITALGILNTIITADTSNISSSSEIGALFGVLQAVESGAGMVGPLAGGVLARIDPVAAPLAAVVALYLVVFAAVTYGYKKYMMNESKPSANKGETKIIDAKKAS